jgi:putative FmdB family regulatory protein
MPLYEYKCAKCGEVFEVIQKFSDEPLKEHPECGGAVERLLSPPALQFKGSGWYVNDYGRNGGSSPAREKSKTDSSESKKSDGGGSGESKAPAKESPSSAKSD